MSSENDKLLNIYDHTCTAYKLVRRVMNKLLGMCKMGKKILRCTFAVKKQQKCADFDIVT